MERCKKHFASKWTSQWSLDPDETIPEREYKPYDAKIRGTQLKVLSKYSKGTTVSGRRAAQRQDLTGNTVVLKQTAKSGRRKDARRPRKHIEQDAFVAQHVTERWNQGDPIGRTEIKIELTLRDDCDEGSEFYKSYIDPNKKSADFGFYNWLDRVLTRYNWSFRTNSIGQTVPENWRDLSEQNSKSLCKLFRDECVDVMLNAD